MYQVKEAEVGGEIYHLKKFKAMAGLAIQKKIYESNLFTEEGINVMALDPETMRDIIMLGCSKGSMGFDAKSFDTHFSGKYMEIFQLVAEILMFNFSDPNASAATEES